MEKFELLPDLPPPANQTGILKWARENLFSNWINIFLSLLAFYLIYLIVPPSLSWLFFEADWQGDTKEACSKAGACWVYVRVKFSQFIYGARYPEAYTWRPDLALGLFLVSVMPFFFSALKKVRKFFTIFLVFGYPLVAFWLINGGLGLPVVETDKWGGLMMTLVFAYVGIIFSFPLAVLLALGRASNLRFIQTLSVVSIEFWRGVPLITILFTASNLLPLFLPEGVEFSKLARAMIGVIIFQAAYMAEVIRGGLQAIPKGQHEAANSLGLNYQQTTTRILLPQALRTVIPNIVGVSISLLKDSTLILIIGLYDVLAIVQLTNSDPKWIGGFETEGYIFVGLLFWICCYLLSRYSFVLEKKFSISKK